LSTDSSPFISIEYDGEEFPTEYEREQMGGYEPEAVFFDNREDPELRTLRNFYPSWRDLNR
jgi:hypothetical protein